MVRLRGEKAERKLPTPAPAFSDSLAYLTAVVRGRVPATDTEPSSLANALVVARILDAARRSAATCRTVVLDKS
ncbi:hypothetical protein PX554_25195 [Sphingomonas sp. H39-1-10]|uniref:hypothetical protein n=1 Tax=Sphingomonas pollutisoli TaxID=3030829 RepID=UPI0023B9BA27|nr:hypothetical protein [Sphingomonas pollutisoli]MDF0491417.1 hypothetical protein [Sphingomonas pollutisoli]